MKRPIGILTVGALLGAALPAAFGGWAVIRVHQLPEYLEAGRETRIAFTVLQHGREPLDHLSPQISVQELGRTGVSKQQRVPAVPTHSRGRYVATIMAPDTGAVRIVIDAGWRNTKATLLPIRVIPPGHVSAAITPVERGRALFVAAGCATCHAKGDDREMTGRQAANIGPPLTGRRFPSDNLARKLADPARDRPFAQWGMPDLGLTEQEIAALVTYVNGGSDATAPSAR